MNDAVSAAALATPAGFEPGYFRDLPAADYFAVEAMSASGAKKMIRSPAHYKLMRDTPSEPTAAMQFGTAVHGAVLEPGWLSANVAIAPAVDKRSAAGKAEWAAFNAANAGRIILSADDLLRVTRCMEAVNTHPAAAKLLAGADTEGSMFWVDGKYHVPCKGRFDARNRGGFIDLKTTTDASPEGFARSAATFLYHVQAAHYLSGAEHALGETPRFFAFIAVETDEPFAVACYVLPPEAVRVGGGLMDLALERYAAALESGRWPGYPTTIDTLPFPRWAMKVNA